MRLVAITSFLLACTTYVGTDAGHTDAGSNETAVMCTGDYAPCNALEPCCNPTFTCNASTKVCQTPCAAIGTVCGSNGVCCSGICNGTCQ